MNSNPADEISQAERRRIMLEERKGSYHSVAAGSADDERRGRFAVAGNNTTVVGASPISYPQQPSTSPWHRDPVGTEPPLGYSVEQQEPTGEKFEIEKGTPASRVHAAGVGDGSISGTEVRPVTTKED